ncbi:AQG_2a_G0041060.mRNA.1.CDS.1 [Saccharomyces cerevisiae]|uniref:C-22 sterol desaturase ERG5 n=9 Tax=Saccharomyces TaxID=4930 RepID=ERG5_YEAST|nr:C-22 sterol desaturase [Saccharomyces cerevisiae S288C]P54781.1 RecName: Full=C-22 sterol desaturase ERG5; AltName: Full=Cytochrome P450 61; AltName: Full=Ergosterol biosynthetic protein 5 [Saccharomyces cerevisiae S288C]AAB06217.1 cytochrome P450 [Saccharomyces cerevisiae]AHY76477.1 Erg5p [Saccharomyces cerevisiae YJM993]AJP40721.1 Erg5p [Saccharomyces cerevisiae YJM1078]AJS61889.1 Erg5p [Saccharomyces cerevisiae YJM189]AJS62328.1 Erg5p [Saccharomyces cerevisiae YJM193]AJS63636.1 Erg5p [|eukprot:NP_013728.1 C-22 sterol desaturase [Saccharomyces cerevisiae S288C]
MSSVAENIIQHATHNSTLHQLAKDQPSVGVTTAFSILDTLKSMSYLKIFATLICILLVWDQVAYQIKKGSIAGPKFKFWPIIGPFLESLDPKFEEYKAKWASGPLSCVSIFHKFVVIASTRDLARKILQSSKFVKPCVVDVAVKILRPCNWVFLDGKAHTDYRKSLNGLFTKQALAQYLPSLEQIMDKYMDKFVRLSKENNYEPQVFFHEMREILCALSLNSFCGNYITEDQVRKIADDYYLVTAALELVNFPIIIPYTKTWYGKKTADMAMKIFENCAQMAKDHIAAGGKPVCVMDAWCKLMHDAKNSNDDDSRIYHREFTNKEISEAVFTFLFASQDASSSLACWLFQIVADRPDVLAKIREEQLAVRNNDMSTELNLDLIEKMKYTNMVIKETLRYRPPVLMVPYVVKKNFPVSPNYTAPKGAMLIPTLYPALHDPEVYENPDEFIPERWVEGSKASEAKKNWLVFGCGPHVCLGQTYVMITFAALLGKFALYTDFHHTVTPLSEKIKVFATIFPKDDLLLTFKKRDPITGEVFE